MIPKKPIDATWTDEQWLAIYEDNKNIIVSAGAGSGKTAVLTERVIRKLKDNVRVNELLILTFTKAAAEEMKDRIRKKIKKNNDLKSNLNLLDSSYITTFDSFALSVVKKYHYLLNIPSSINIIDSNIINLEKNKIMDSLFLEYYEKENPLFLKMIDTFCTKDDINLRSAIIKISNKLDLLSNKEEYLNEYLNNYFNEEKLNKDIILYTELIEEKINSIKEKVKELSYMDAEFASKLTDSLTLLYEHTDYNDLVTRLNIKLPQAPRGSEEELKEKKKEITEVLNEIKELAEYKDEEEIKRTILNTYDTVSIIIDILKEFDKRMKQYKKEKNSYEFSDIAIMAINVVKENEIVRKELKSMFKEIMIDEYQDTNDLQEEFITLISNNNTYMVGDIKQSIYRFRNANPYIFKNKYDAYTISTTDCKIDLNKNFRSRKEVLDNINLIFIQIMNDKIGGSNYLESHQMIFGNNSYLKEKTNQSNNMEIYNYAYDKSDIFTKEEIESFIIVKDIKEKINNNYQVFDKDTSLLRNIRYEDFAIIMDRSASFDLYKKIFNYFGIPVTLLKEEKMESETDILIINNIIKLLLKIKNNIIDTEFKYLFTSISRSFLFETHDDEIFTYFENNNYKESELYLKCKEITPFIDTLPIEDILNKIIESFSYFEKYIKIGSISGGIIKITKLKETAKNLETLNYTFEDFSNYLTDILKGSYSIEYEVPDNGSSSVKIMTIHKSKGLEYPICYFSGLYKEFNISDIKDKFLIDKKYGIMTPYFEEGIKETIYKRLLKRDFLEEEISEKIRLFYVALTRAREKIILVTPQEDKEMNIDNQTVLDNSIKMNYKSFKDILSSIKNKTEKNYIFINTSELNLTKEYNFIKKIPYKDKISKNINKLNIEEINITPYLEEKNTFSKKIDKLITKEENRIMKYGTKMHEYLEYLDLKNPNLDLIDNIYCKEKIKSFLNQPILSNINNSNIYHEYEFIYDNNNNTYHGIIDLMLEYKDHIDIIDYKLKNIDDEKYQDQLNGYKKYISTLTNKEINIYLYSLIDETLKKLR